MSKRKKVNKLKVILAIFVFIVFFMTVTGLGKFVYDTIKNGYLTSKKFYFTSDLLTSLGINTYNYEDWDGEGTYEIEFELYSQNNNLQQFTEDLNYTLMLDYDHEKIQCSLSSVDFSVAESASGTIDTYQDRVIPVATHTQKVKIYVQQKDGANLEIDNEIPLKITAYTTEPYRKSLSATFDLKIAEVSYVLEDKGAGSPFVILNIRNISEKKSEMTIELADSVVRSSKERALRLDITDSLYRESKEIGVDDDGHVNKFVFDMDPETSRDIKLYKKSIWNNELSAEDASNALKITRKEIE